MLAAYSPVPGFGWAVVAQVPAAVALRDAPSALCAHVVRTLSSANGRPNEGIWVVDSVSCQTLTKPAAW
jgi:hypothetical protein